MPSAHAAAGHALRINEQLIQTQQGETVLQAALRAGIPFPNSCRVGGCGTCRCRVVEGDVRELTESGYLLSGQEIKEGVVLACQTVPRSDVVIDVAIAPAGTPGKVIAQEKLTHDITRLVLQCEAAIPYRSGQFALLQLQGLEGVTRSYSFASPPQADGQVEFFVRKVEGGQFSGLVNDQNLIGRVIHVGVAQGDFWLRSGDEPLLLVAGGSGLAPVLALLEDAVSQGVSRKATLVFGAREERDLFALDRIAALQKAWLGEFTFVPVLSAAAHDSSWPGRRGFVTDVLAEFANPSAHGYLCGPPPMVDAAEKRLRACGLDPAHIHADRFLTQADALRGASSASLAPSAQAEVAGFFDYAKYAMFHLVGLFSAATLLAGGGYITAGFLAVIFAYVVGDALSGEDTRTPVFRHPWVLTLQLWLALPLMCFIAFAAVWSVSSSDIFGFGAWLGGVVGVDLLAAREATSFGHHVSGWLLTGLMIGLVGTIPAHELTHRTWDRMSMGVGRWLLAFSFDTSFSVEHVYGHHRYVSTTADPATAPRGRNVYMHILLSTIRGNVSAWRIEAERLAKRDHSVFSWRNAVARGYAMTLVLVLIAFALGGWVGAGFFIACGLWGKAVLEIVNFMEHYGIVRDPATPVQPRHSWNTTKRATSWTMFNLSRHSHHHAQGEVPFHELKPMPEAPVMVGGYLTTLLLTLVPPLWRALMKPKLQHWDSHYATPQERVLAAAAEARS